MADTDPPRSLEEVARLGPEVYERHVRPKLGPDDDFKFAAIDVDTGEFEVDGDDDSAVMRLRARIPGAEIWLERVGSPTAYALTGSVRSSGWRFVGWAECHEAHHVPASRVGLVALGPPYMRSSSRQSSFDPA